MERGPAQEEPGKEAEKKASQPSLELDKVAKMTRQERADWQNMIQNLPAEEKQTIRATMKEKLRNFRYDVPSTEHIENMTSEEKLSMTEFVKMLPPGERERVHAELLQKTREMKVRAEKLREQTRKKEQKERDEASKKALVEQELERRESQMIKEAWDKVQETISAAEDDLEKEFLERGEHLDDPDREPTAEEKIGEKNQEKYEKGVAKEQLITDIATTKTKLAELGIDDPDAELEKRIVQGTLESAKGFFKKMFNEKARNQDRALKEYGDLQKQLTELISPSL